MLKLVSKFAMDILPSVIATIIGAYIVNHYINNKPPADASVTAATVPSSDLKKANSKPESKPAEKSADLGNLPEPGVRAKGVAEKSIIDKSAVEKSAEKPPEKSPEKPAEKVDKPSDTASIPPSAPADSRRHQSAPREKAASRTAPATTPPPVAPQAPSEAVAAAPTIIAPAENAPDVNDLARAAIERLRGAPEASRSQEPARAEPPRVVAAPAQSQAPVVTAPPLQPLPPPILVATPPDTKPLYPPTARGDDLSRPTPPADIPDPRPPLDLRADAVDSAPRQRPSVADDVISAAKSVFQSVLPK
jgi:hypothetical protein